VYEPLPPETEEIKVVDWPALMELGEAKQEMFKVGVGLLTATEQLADIVWLPDITLTVAVLVPALVCVLVQFWEEPVQAPDHE